jgi:2-methylcitrate dehydratase PrpD
MVLDGLGKVWRTMETEFKPYPNCRCNHGGIDGIIKLMRENNIRPEDIIQIQIWGDSWLLNPLRSHETIKNCIDTQFSVKYAFAVAACYGEKPGPLWEMSVIYEDPKIMEMMKKVKVEEHPKANELILENLQAGKPPVLWLSAVKITAKVKEYSTEILEHWGKVKNQLSSGEILRKFTKCRLFPFAPVQNCLDHRPGSKFGGPYRCP